MPEIFNDTNFWVLLATVIFVALVFKPARRTVSESLDARAAKIRAELDEARQLREQAQALLAEYQRQQQQALADAQTRVAEAQQEAARLRERAVGEIEAMARRREAQAMDKIAQAEAAATQEVRNQAVDVAIAATRKLLQQQLADGQAAQQLTQAAIADLPKRLH